MLVCMALCALLVEWKTEHYADMTILLSKCPDVYSADVPAALQV